MPISALELAQAGTTAIDLYMKNKPMDSINAERPYLKALMGGKVETGGTKQYLVQQVRKANDHNFQSFYGSDAVTYNRKDTVEQAQHTYWSFHDGFSLHEDDFIHNGIAIGDGPGKQATADEKVNLTNLLTENTETLRQGCEEQLNLSVLEGTSGTYGVPGLDDMVPLVPGATVDYGGLDRGVRTYWQSNVSLSVTDTATTGTIEEQMRVVWRACVKYGGRPTHIFVGADFLDAFINYMLHTYGRVNYGPVSTKSVEGAAGMIYYEGVELVWDPTFDSNLTDQSSSHPWAQRCYMLNMKEMKLRPIKKQWMVPRTPPRVYNKYEYYWGLTSRYYIVSGRPTTHGLLTLAS
jgi:hypothetical protein